MARARTLSFALATIGLIAVAAPASAKEPLFKTRVELTRVMQTEAGDYRVKGRVHSPDERCRQSKARSVYLREEGVFGRTDWKDPTITRRGKFSIRVPQSEEGSTFRVKANGVHHEAVGYKCKSDVSRRFTLASASEAGIAAGAPVPEDFDDLREVETRVEVTRVVQKAAGNYRVKGRVHSRNEVCTRRGVHVQKVNDHGELDWMGNQRGRDGTTRRGKFSIWVPQSEQGSTFQVLAGTTSPKGHPGLKCESDKSRRFRIRPSSEAGVAGAASASAAAGGHKYDTKVTITHEAPRPDGNVFWHGGVHSKVIKCERERRVILFRQRPGADRRLGAARRPAGHLGPGAWGLRAPQDGRVYAKVKREVLDDGDVCRRDRSVIVENGDLCPQEPSFCPPTAIENGRI